VEIHRKLWNFGFLGSGEAENPKIDVVGNMEIEIEVWREMGLNSGIHLHRTFAYLD